LTRGREVAVRRVLLLISWCVIGTALNPSGALANGNYSHVWIAADALNYLEDGDLKDLLGGEGLVEKMRVLPVSVHDLVKSVGYPHERC